MMFNVLDAPTCRKYDESTVVVLSGDTVNISCQVDANPSDIDFVWSSNQTSKVMPVSNKYYNSSGTSSILTYKIPKFFNNIMLLCWARNEIGVQEKPCVYYVKQASK